MDPTAEVRDFSWQATCLQNSTYRGHRSYLEESRKLSLSSPTKYIWEYWDRKSLKGKRNIVLAKKAGHPFWSRQQGSITAKKMRRRSYDMIYPRK
jgi:hypothetical protein